MKNDVTIKTLNNKTPKIDNSAFVAEGSRLIGDILLKENVSIWYNAVLRGDLANITVGANSNVQDNCTIHSDEKCDVIIGDNVTIGHNAIIHGSIIEDNVLIGMGAVVLDKAIIGTGSIVGAGAVVTGGTVIPPNSLVLGMPAKIIKTINNSEENKEHALNYAGLSKKYL